MTHELPDNNSAIIKKRFERDAAAFNAIYDKKSEFSGWFNQVFRKPIFERYDITFQSLGNLTGKTILDVGCGSGVYATQCALNGATRVKGIDFSEPMLDIARNRAESHQVTHICDFEAKDFLTMPAQEQFNFAIVMGVFDYLADPLTFLKKLKLMTKDRIVASFPGHSLLRQPLRQLRYLLTTKGKVYFYRYQDIAALAQQVAFRQVEIRPMITGSGFVLIADVS